MELHSLPWWVWALVSIPLGWLLYLSNSGSAEPAGVIRTDRQEDFEWAILHAPVGPDKIPWVRNLVVYPPIDALGAGNKTIRLMSVTYEALEPKKGGQANEFEYTPRWVRATIPYATCNRQPTFNARFPQPDNVELPPGIEKTYVPDPTATVNKITTAVYGKDTPLGREALAQANTSLRQLNPARPVQDVIDAGRFRAGQALWVPWNPERNLTVIDWLKEATKDYSWVQYKHAWWKEPQYAMTVWMGGTFLVVGLLWPMAISVMVGAGLGGRSGKEEDYDLSHYGQGRPEAKRVAAKKEVGEEEMAKVAAMNDALTASLKEGLSDRGPAGATPAPPKEAAAVKPFVAAPAEAVVIPEAPVQESKEFKGEFYPVAQPKTQDKGDSGKKG